MINEKDSIVLKEEFTNGETIHFDKYWEILINKYGIPFGQYIISICYAIYARFTLFNVIMFLIKCVPTGIYMHKFIKSIYTTSRERLKQKQSELEDLQLQVQIVTTKLSVRDAEFAERVEQLRRSVERLRRVRARVRQVIAADEDLRRNINSNNNWDDDSDINVHCTPEEESEFIVELLKELKCDQIAEWEPKKTCGEDAGEPLSQENSVYSSISDSDSKECHVKIVRVTNVYKVAYLKHYIKQKRLRRANKQALLKKKMDSIKKLLDDWQKTLNMAINSKLSLLNMNPQYIKMTPQEAMGDSNSNCRDFSDSDSDFRNSVDNGPDEYSLSWTQNSYVQQQNMCICNFDDYETAVSKELYDHPVIFNDKYPPLKPCDCNGKQLSNLVVVPEETTSQMAIEELGSEASGDGDCRDLVAM
ncbi:uncharacterized protein LOC123705638 [Colias croceus]|uniref:uncharacterized protein LOC123705638 n=1 Tax=Colias crocea TaxID=72248 RepID=UPI001E27B2A6|nr:uncharacterized protein LOC123705638 [Colias croceus]